MENTTEPFDILRYLEHTRERYLTGIEHGRKELARWEGEVARTRAEIGLDERAVAEIERAVVTLTLRKWESEPTLPTLLRASPPPVFTSRGFVLEEMGGGKYRYRLSEDGVELGVVDAETSFDPSAWVKGKSELKFEEVAK